MAEPGQTFPLEFALGILQTKKQLAERRAELNEAREARRVQQSLEYRRQQIQQLAIQTESENDAANRQARIGMAEMELKNRESVNEAELQFHVEELKQKRQAMENNILAKIGKEPVYAPSWMKLPASIQGPMVKNEAGEEVPEYEVAVEPDDAGGHMIVPIRSQTARMEYEKLRAQRDQILESSLLSTVRQKLVKAQTEKYEEDVAQLRAGMSPTRANSAIEAWLKLKETVNTEALMAGKPLPEMTEDERQIRETIIQRAKAADAALRWRQAGPGERATQNRTPLGMSPAEIEERAAGADLDEKLPGEFKGTIEVPVIIDLSKGREGATYRDVNLRQRAAPGPRQGLGKRRIYYDQTGKEVGFELYSNDGTFIKAEGRTPRSEAAPPQQPTLQAPPSASSGTQAPPTVQPQSDTNMNKRLEELADKILDGTATDDDKKEYARLRGR